MVTPSSGRERSRTDCRQRRPVPFAAFLENPLKQLCRGRPADDLGFTDLQVKHLPRAKTQRGTNSWFTTPLAIADIERLTPHDLRHTATSLAISSGANVNADQRMFGHKSAAVTLDTYADLFDDLAVVAERMNQGGLNADVGHLWAN